MNLPKSNKCLICKGSDPRRYCYREFCPIVAKSKAFFRVKEKLTKESFESSAPSVFVGHNFYPNLNVGVLSPVEIKEDAWVYDAPRYWAEHNFQIPQVIDFRSALINSRFVMNVKSTGKFLDITKQVGIASKPVELEISLKEKPRFRLNTDAYIAPTGPRGKLERARITSNPKISYRVEKIVNDDIKAGSALVYLYKHGFDENFLTRVLSVGSLGFRKNRKLVPTRWSISCVDDTIGKNFIKELKNFNSVNYLAYFGGYLGNYYLVLFFPEPWSYELFETYAPKAEWNVSNEYRYMTDYESYEGRKSYAENTGGGYYAARLPIVEKLSEMKKQGSVLALRFITGEYAVPLGVWVCRESTRKALESKPLEFGNIDLMLRYAKDLIKKKFNYDIDVLLKASRLIDKIKKQRKLTQY